MHVKNIKFKKIVIYIKKREFYTTTKKYNEKRIMQVFFVENAF